jgi:hypothetical protein
MIFPFGIYPLRLRAGDALQLRQVQAAHRLGPGPWDEMRAMSAATARKRR